MIQNILSLKWIDSVYYTITDPKKLYHYLIEKNNGFLPLTFIIPVAAAAIEIVTLSSMTNQTEFFYTKITYGWILLIFIYLFKILFITLGIDFILQLMGYKGNSKFLITLVNLAYLPNLFILPGSYIFKFVNFAPGFFYGMFSFLIIIWSMLIVISGISELHSISFSKALATYIIPYLFFIVSMFFISLLLVFIFFGFINTF